MGCGWSCRFCGRRGARRREGQQRPLGRFGDCESSREVQQKATAKLLLVYTLHQSKSKMLNDLLHSTPRRHLFDERLYRFGCRQSFVARLIVSNRAVSCTPSWPKNAYTRVTGDWVGEGTVVDRRELVRVASDCSRSCSLLGKEEGEGRVPSAECRVYRREWRRSRGEGRRARCSPSCSATPPYLYSTTEGMTSTEQIDHPTPVVDYKFPNLTTDFPQLRNDLLLRSAANESPLDLDHPPIWVMRQAGEYSYYYCSATASSPR